MFKIKTDLIKKFENQLKAFREKALPFATKDAINSAAFVTMRDSKERIKKDFILKNKFTERSIRVQKTNSLDINKQESRVGSTADYMAVQEFGGSKTKKGKHGVVLPTSVAAGQGEGSKPRRKVPVSRFKMSSIELRDKGRGFKSKKQANALAIKLALQKSRKFVYLEFRNKKGIFAIQGNSRTLKVSKLRMIYDLSHEHVRIPQHQWLEPSVKQTEKKFTDLYFKALKQQLERFNLFKKL